MWLDSSSNGRGKVISKKCRVLIAGGGTAGHVIPAVSIAQTLLENEILRDIDEVHFVGSKRGVGKELVAEAGFGLTILPGRGIERKLSLQNLFSIILLCAALFRAGLLMIKTKPEVIVIMGGYASLACGLAGKLFTIPLVVAEQNSVPGSTNKILSRFAEVSAISFDGVDLPRAVMTGNPLRREILNFLDEGSREESRRKLEVGAQVMITVFGGSLGARRINEAVFDLAQQWTGRNICIFHVFGKRDWSYFSEQNFRASEKVDYRMFEYVKDMTELLGASDLVICRSGATTVSEITALGIPSILIPLPNSPGDHQTENAKYFESRSSAVLLPDVELDSFSLARKISHLLENDKHLAEMSDNAKSLARLDASEEVGNLVAEIIKKGSYA